MREQQPLNTGGYVFFLKLSSCEQKKLDSASFLCGAGKKKACTMQLTWAAPTFEFCEFCWVENKGAFSSKNSRRLPFLQH